MRGGGARADALPPEKNPKSQELDDLPASPDGSLLLARDIRTIPGLGSTEFSAENGSPERVVDGECFVPPIAATAVSVYPIPSLQHSRGHLGSRSSLKSPNRGSRRVGSPTQSRPSANQDACSKEDEKEAKNLESKKAQRGEDGNGAGTRRQPWRSEDVRAGKSAAVARRSGTDGVIDDHTRTDVEVQVAEYGGDGAVGGGAETDGAEAYRDDPVVDGVGDVHAAAIGSQPVVDEGRSHGSPVQSPPSSGREKGPSLLERIRRSFGYRSDPIKPSPDLTSPPVSSRTRSKTSAARNTGDNSHCKAVSAPVKVTRTVSAIITEAGLPLPDIAGGGEEEPQHAPLSPLSASPHTAPERSGPEGSVDFIGCLHPLHPLRVLHARYANRGTLPPLTEEEVLPELQRQADLLGMPSYPFLTTENRQRPREFVDLITCLPPTDPLRVRADYYDSISNPQIFRRRQEETRSLAHETRFSATPSNPNHLPLPDAAV